MISPSRGDWSLQRKGPVDQARHMDKIREAIKENLPDIISEESIITSSGDKVIRVPIRSLEEYRFRYDPDDGEKVGQGEGETQVGDVLGRVPQSGKGQGGKAGDRPGVDYYEVEITVDELAELIFEDLGLPNLRETVQQEVPADAVKWTDVRKKGPMGNLDKRRSIMESMRRTAREDGEAAFRGLTQDDLRFRVWEQDVKYQSAAAVIAMRDASGSMGDFKKYLTRSMFFWMIRFLRTRYEDVKIVFIVHTADAREVDEEEFFSLGESGGTRVSTAYELCHTIMQERFDPSAWNVYPFHFTDGDNWSDGDNKLCIEWVKKILASANLFGYGEIREPGHKSNLMSALESVGNARLVTTTITDRVDVYPALRRWFNRDAKVAWEG